MVCRRQRASYPGIHVVPGMRNGRLMMSHRDRDPSRPPTPEDPRLRRTRLDVGIVREEGRNRRTGRRCRQAGGHVPTERHRMSLPPIPLWSNTNGIFSSPRPDRRRACRSPPFGELMEFPVRQNRTRVPFFDPVRAGKGHELTTGNSRFRAPRRPPRHAEVSSGHHWRTPLDLLHPAPLLPLPSTFTGTGRRWPR